MCLNACEFKYPSVINTIKIFVTRRNVLKCKTTIGDKIAERTKLGCLLLSTGSAYSSTTLFSGGREGKASYFPFEVGTIG